MTPGTWQHAVQQLSNATKPVTPEQLRLAKHARITIPPDTPEAVAAALLRVALAEQLQLDVESTLSAYFASMVKKLRRGIRLAIDPQTDEEAVAWVDYLRRLKRKKYLSKHKPEAGDVLELSHRERVEVSSVDAEGRVFLKGGRGYRSWPDQIDSVLARKDEGTPAAIQVRLDARNTAAQRASSPEWSAARSEDMAEFAVWNSATEKDVNELEEVIDGATDERPIQKFLEERPWLLTALLGGKERFCIPQKRLGAEFIPDFVLGDVDSLGVRWILVELETPDSGIYLKSGGSLDQFARKGADQIVDWRDWLMNNIAYAQKPRRSQGLGLPDISNYSEGLVLVGRRSKRPRTTDAKRRELRQTSHIRIHSYDWLLSKLRGALVFEGPPGSNPNLLKRLREIDDPFSRPR